MKRIRVKEIHDQHSSAFKTVEESTSLDTVVRSFASGSTAQAVFVVDDTGLYRGAITRKHLLNWVAVKIVGGESARSLSIGNMRSILFAAAAGDLMRQGFAAPAVPETMDLAEALKMMMDSGEPILPVVDEAGKLVVRVSEILDAVLRYGDGVNDLQDTGGARG
jgi:CBS domain-containing protein